MIDRTVTILLVDDDEVDAMAVERGFRALGIANPVLRARDGEQAIQALRDHSASDRASQPMVVLLDLQLPRLSGIETLREIRRDPALRRTVVFVLTTSESDEDRLAAYDLNVAGYLVKSQLPTAFLERLEMLDRYCHVVELP